MADLRSETDTKEEETEEEEQDQTEEEESEEEEMALDDIKDPAAKLKAESEKNQRLTRKLRKAEKESAAAAKALKEQEDAKKSDQEKLQERADAAEKRVAELESTLRKSEVKDLILDHPDVERLPKGQKKQIMRMVPLDDVEVDEDGESNIDELISDLKESVPALFALDEEGDDSDTADSGSAGKRTAPAPKKRKSRDELDRAQLEARFPHLAKHR